MPDTSPHVNCSVLNNTEFAGTVSATDTYLGQPDSSSTCTFAAKITGDENNRLLQLYNPDDPWSAACQVADHSIQFDDCSVNEEGDAADVSTTILGVARRIPSILDADGNLTLATEYFFNDDTLTTIYLRLASGATPAQEELTVQPATIAAIAILLLMVAGLCTVFGIIIKQVCRASQSRRVSVDPQQPSRRNSASLRQSLLGRAYAPEHADPLPPTTTPANVVITITHDG